MTTELINDQIVMESNGAGYNTYRFPIPNMPDDADMLVLSFRYWYDTYTSSESGNAGWDGSDCFGLSFSGVIPDDSSQDDFFGWVDTNVGQNFIYSPTNSNFNNQDVIIGNNSHSIMNGEGSSLGTIGSDEHRFMPAFGKPANPTVGKTYTGVLVFKRDAGSLDKILISTGGNFGSLTDLSDARLDSSTVYGEEDTILTVGASGNWRNGGGINFPTWLMAKFTSSINGKKFVLDSYHVQFYNYCT